MEKNKTKVNTDSVFIALMIATVAFLAIGVTVMCGMMFAWLLEAAGLA